MACLAHSPRLQLGRYIAGITKAKERTTKMTSIVSTNVTTPRRDWLAVARELGPGFASRAPALDANDSFGAENFRELKEHRILSAGVPAELGGGGASHRELCAMMRELGRHCGATALSLSMHMHLVATTVWQHRQGRPVAPMLERIAAEELMLVTSSASDWLDSTGTAEKVEGGYRVSMRKHFVSGSPAGDILVTSVVYEDPSEGPVVLHFAAPMKGDDVSVLDNWRTMSMRSSGSNDVVLEGVFVPEAAVSMRRPRGAWPAMFEVVAAVALPLITSVYLGVAEAARDRAIELVSKKRDDENLWYLVGEMENALATGRMAVQGLIDLCDDYNFAPSLERVNDVLTRKTIAAESLLQAVEKALQVVGGGAIFRSTGLERFVRDIHAAQFHPLQPKRQHRFTGRMVLGLDPIG
jgi:alkylation response protein AidB-like acyl-CoA dehydrogenase